MVHKQDPTATYRATFDRARQQPEAFWLEQARALDWHTKPTTALDYDGKAQWKWFPDGRLNITYQALDRWVAEGRGDQPALIWDSAMTQQQITYTYAQLLDQVARFAGALRAQGIERGDRVLIYMPMIPEALIAMLAVARLGAIHVVTFGGFAPKEVATRLDDAKPKALIAANGGLEPSRAVRYLPNVAEAIGLATHRPDVVIVKQRDEIDDTITEFDVSWLDFDEQLSTSEPVDAVPVAATDPLYLLHTSGTTSKPKAVIRDHGGYAVAAAWSVPNIYDVAPGEVMFVASDVGWVVGHTYIVYAPLVAGATTVMYEGKPVGTPDAGALWRVASEHGAKMIFSAPTAYRAIRAADPAGEQWQRYDMSNLTTIFSAGERLDEDTYHWLGTVTGKPVVDHWWQTETGWPIVANLRGLAPMPLKAGSPSVPVPGYDVGIVNPLGEPVEQGTEGNIVIKLPLPPGAMVGLYGEPERFHLSYLAAFDGYYETGDTGYIDDDGYVFVLGRSDDVINVAGHRLSTGTLESVIAEHPAVAETAVIGVTDGLKGQKPVAYVVLTADADISPEQLAKELVAKVRKDFGAVAAFRDVDVVSALPKTRSGKILRRTMRSIVEGEDVAAPATIDDAGVLDTFALQATRWES
ncbi:AMP-binding protein [Enteractinococcus helveticum]|uniref:Propionyl-CoA synthetase n=1 Tax=Enteractinococcus helveticum TaxID=1837282 RepID=A0A1B7M359_9MICC|nr:AMP-binding protein [Enteractinococcus helveticum]OAV63021.1 propionyl-CoA synthetase [Enteractinococcus helveticum]